MSKKDIILKAENISKQYRLGVVGTGTISHDLNRWWYKVRGKEDPFLKIGESNDRTTKGESQYVWALKDINFEVERGEVLGIIGKNGAGKSTLLKILSRVTGPTTGSIKCGGRIASLLEVGTGFHPELTGRENIFLNGAILGMTKAEINKKLEEIIDFAGVERYIDTPVKRYSSGMTVRLAFAVAAHLEPDILVVDEVLAVGDAEFQKKAIGKMQDISRGEGKTVLFVSHNMASVRSLCNSGIVIENGMIAFRGTADEAVDNYLKGEENNSDLRSKYRKEEKNSKEFTILEADLIDINNKHTTHFDFNEEITIRIKYEVKKELVGSIVNIIVSKNTNDVCMTFDSDMDMERFETRKTGLYESIVKLPKQRLKPGIYDLSIGTGVALKGAIEQLDKSLQFKISDRSKEYPYSSYLENRRGIVPLVLKWKTTEINSKKLK